MGHILFGAPRIAHYHLQLRLARLLEGRGHRVTLLATQPADADFFAAQGLEVRALSHRGRPQRGAVPLADLALLDTMLQRRGTGYRRRRARALARRAGAFGDALATGRPDVLFFVDGRDAEARLLHHLGRQCGLRILHTGEGLLPGTMQWDAEGVDGDATTCRRRPGDYARVRVDHELLAMATAAWLAGNRTLPLPRLDAVAPARPRRWWSSLGCIWRGDLAEAARAARAWRNATARSPAPEAAPPLPPPPYTVLLLQRDECPRLRLDAADEVRRAAVVDATVAAARALDPRMSVVAITPTDRPTAREVRDLLRRRAVPRPPSAAPQAIATASAVVTVNHPLGVGALLVNTPLLHLGRTPYGIDGVAFGTSLARLVHDLPMAIETDPSPLREQFLSHCLGRDHLWCAAGNPDHNGLSGLAAAIERGLAPGEPPLRYRCGPAWPLSTAASRTRHP